MIFLTRKKIKITIPCCGETGALIANCDSHTTITMNMTTSNETANSHRGGDGEVGGGGEHPLSLPHFQLASGTTTRTSDDDDDEIVERGVKRHDSSSSSAKIILHETKEILHETMEHVVEWMKDKLVVVVQNKRTPPGASFHEREEEQAVAAGAAAAAAAEVAVHKKLAAEYAAAWAADIIADLSAIADDVATASFAGDVAPQQPNHGGVGEPKVDDGTLPLVACSESSSATLDASTNDAKRVNMEEEKQVEEYTKRSEADVSNQPIVLETDIVVVGEDDTTTADSSSIVPALPLDASANNNNGVEVLVVQNDDTLNQVLVDDNEDDYDEAAAAATSSVDAIETDDASVGGPLSIFGPLSVPAASPSTFDERFQQTPCAIEESPDADTAGPVSDGMPQEFETNNTHSDVSQQPSHSILNPPPSSLPLILLVRFLPTWFPDIL
jgi:hypothetical protein